MRKSLIAVAAALCCALAGCTVDGTPTRGPIQLQTGKYGSMQARPAGEATSDAAWAKLRGVRLADHMIFAHELDPVLDDGKLPTQPLATPTNVQIVIPNTANLPVMKDFEYGFTLSSGNGSVNDTGINHAVFVFTDAAAAKDAVTQMSGVMLKRTTYSDYSRVRVDGMPSESVTIHSPGAGGRHTVAAFTAIGQRVVYTWADAKNRAWPDRIVKAAYDQQAQLLDGVEADDSDRRIDPDNLLPGTLEDPDDSNPLYGSVYGQRAIALFYSDQSAAYEAVKKAGIERFAWNSSQLYKAGSESQAKGWIDFLVKDFDDDTSRKAASPQDLGSARCMTKDAGTGCSVAVGPYVGEVYGKTLVEAQQQISAQYTFMEKLAG